MSRREAERPQACHQHKPDNPTMTPRARILSSRLTNVRTDWKAVGNEKDHLKLKSEADKLKNHNAGISSFIN